MTVTSRIGAWAVLVVIAITPISVQAQNLKDFRTPAEIPPETYRGKQYVDSRGCVYIRAGIDGNVSWVPRVNPNRTVICRPGVGSGSATAIARQTPRDDAGPMAPSAGRTVASAPSTIEMPDATPRTLPSPLTAPGVERSPTRILPTAPSRPATMMQPAVRTATTATDMSRSERQIASAPEPKPTVAPVQARTKPARVATRTPARKTRKIRRSPARARSDVYVPRADVVSAPVPVVYHVTMVSPSPATRGAKVGEYQTRELTLQPGSRLVIVPKHVYVQRQNTRNVVTPEGYRGVWEDGRLNPHRAEMTANGQYRSAQVMTRTVPREVINADNPGAVYRGPRLVEAPRVGYRSGSVSPVTRGRDEDYDPGRNRTAAVTSASHAQVVRPLAPPAQVRVVTPAPQVRYVTPQTRSHAGAQFIQVAMFAEDANARRTAQRLANAGMSVRIRNQRSKGRIFRSVIAGPFHGAADARSALGRIRAAGFRDAYFR